MRTRTFGIALIVVLVLGLALAPVAPAPVEAQPFGGLTLSVDRGAGGTYALGEPIIATYVLPTTGTMRLYRITSAGRQLVTEGLLSSTTGTINLIAGPPTGLHRLVMELYTGAQFLARGETSYNVGGSPTPGTVIGCNSSLNGGLQGPFDQVQYTFAGTAGTFVSASVAATGGIPLRITITAPSGQVIQTGTNYLPPQAPLPYSANYTITVAGTGQMGARPILSFQLSLTCTGNPTPPAQQATISVDRGQGGTYQLGQPIYVNYTLPQPGYLRVVVDTSTGKRIADQGPANATVGSMTLIAGPPAGLHRLRLHLIVNNQTVASAETYYYVQGGLGLALPPTDDNELSYQIGPNLACNTSVAGQLVDSGDNPQLAFSASAGTVVSASLASSTPLTLELIDPLGLVIATGQNGLPATRLDYDGEYRIELGEEGPFGVALNASYALTLNCTAPAVMQPVTAPTIGQTVLAPFNTVVYPAGWNIVGGPVGTEFPVPLYEWDPLTESYELVPAGQPVEAGQGYWAYFAQPTTVNLLGAGHRSVAVEAPALQWVQVANPSPDGSAVVIGAEVLYVLDPATNSFVEATSLAPGQGGLAMSTTNGYITITAQ